MPNSRRCWELITFIYFFSPAPKLGDDVFIINTCQDLEIFAHVNAVVMCLVHV